MHYDGKYGRPLFKFGHGLSYSEFKVVPATDALTVSTAKLQTVGYQSLVFTITNAKGPAGAYSLLCFIQSGVSLFPLRCFGHLACVYRH